MSIDPTATTQTTPEAPADDVSAGASQLEHVTEDLLVEDVSIDGMCGVY